MLFRFVIPEWTLCSVTMPHPGCLPFHRARSLLQALRYACWRRMPPLPRHKPATSPPSPPTHDRICRAAHGMKAKLSIEFDHEQARFVATEVTLPYITSIRRSHEGFTRRPPSLEYLESSMDAPSQVDTLPSFPIFDSGRPCCGGKG